MNMKKVLVALFALVISGCATVSSTKTLLETPTLDNIVIRVALQLKQLQYTYQYDTEDSQETLKERTLRDAEIFLKELEDFLPKEMSRLVGTQPGQTRFISPSEFDSSSGTNGHFWIKVDRMDVTCMEHSKRCVTDKSDLRTTLVYKNKPSWESRLNVTVGANFTGEDNDRVTMKRIAKKLVEQLAKDGYIAQPFNE